jgi:hypothetical protein
MEATDNGGTTPIRAAIGSRERRRIEPGTPTHTGIVMPPHRTAPHAVKVLDQGGRVETHLGDRIVSKHVFRWRIATVRSMLGAGCPSG